MRTIIDINTVHVGKRSFHIDSVKWDNEANGAFVSFTDTKSGKLYGIMSAGPENRIVRQEIVSAVLEGRV